ncbi:heterokaryon incompatibility protein-domain-containing protein, partial [Lasiosphaeria miniovina]
PRSRFSPQHRRWAHRQWEPVADRLRYPRSPSLPSSRVARINTVPSRLTSPRSGCSKSRPARQNPISSSVSLIHVNLDNKGTIRASHPDFKPFYEFKALSYTWGKPKFDESILVDGHAFPITKNLKEALVRLRKDPDPDINRPYDLAVLPASYWWVDANRPYDLAVPPASYWWIDAVCINQADVLERNAQVAIMRRIYHSASMVQVWVGEEADDSDTAFKLAIELDKGPPRRGPGLTTPAPIAINDDERRKNWKAFAAIFARPWWQRAWVRQEV